MEEITKKEHLEYIDKIRKMITIYHSDGKEHTICPMCGIDFEKLYEFVKELYTKAEVNQEIDKAREEGREETNGHPLTEKLIIKGKTVYATIKGVEYEVIDMDFEERTVFVRADFSDDGDGSDIREEVFDMDKVDYITAV